ncbi:MAG: hypothetical protein HY211_06370 [Candidatus Omnitrophica bacterium]|nr:hypothetical protein [Candidatus Omnitrophota bacterium]
MKILVAHVPAGSGHQRAAEAVAAAIRKLNSSAEVLLLDALEQADPWYRWMFGRGYLDLIQNAPFLWGMMYHLTDFKPFSRPVHWLHRFDNHLHAKPLEDFFIEAKADAIVGSHFLPMEVAGSLKAAGRISARLITSITDYLPHALWIAPAIDVYAVGSSHTKEELRARGVPKDRIRVTGIPVDPKFLQPGDRSLLTKKLGLDPERFTLLIGAGGAGTGPVRRLIHLLGQVREPIQLLAVAGKNDPLRRDLENLRPGFPHPMRVFGFIDNMQELMDVSDLILTKPGGLTCTEAMVKGLPLLLMEPIPGQERRNAHILKGLGAAVLADRLEEVPPLVEKFCLHPEQFQEIRSNAKQASRPDAAYQIAKLAVQ